MLKYQLCDPLTYVFTFFFIANIKKKLEIIDLNFISNRMYSLHSKVVIVKLMHDSVYMA